MVLSRWIPFQPVAALDVDHHFDPVQPAEEEKAIERGPGQFFGRLVQGENGVEPTVELGHAGRKADPFRIPAEGAVDEAFGERHRRGVRGRPGAGAGLELPRIPALKEEPGDAVVVQCFRAPAEVIQGRRHGPGLGQELGRGGGELLAVVAKLFPRVGEKAFDPGDDSRRRTRSRAHPPKGLLVLREFPNQDEINLDPSQLAVP